MPSIQTTQFLCGVLRGHRTSDDARDILRLLDDGEAKVAEFDSTLRAVASKIPGLTLDFDKLIAGDPIECDPLISHGNLAILRLDAIYYQAFQAWTNSGGSLHTFKRTTTPPNNEHRTDRIEKHQRTDETYPPDAQLLNQLVNITLSGFRIQATITHRRDQLSHPGSAHPQTSLHGSPKRQREIAPHPNPTRQRGTASTQDSAR